MVRRPGHVDRDEAVGECTARPGQAPALPAQALARGDHAVVKAGCPLLAGRQQRAHLLLAEGRRRSLLLGLGELGLLG